MTRAAVLALGVLLLAAVPASAQYFGRNKVQYEDFDFRILQTPHFDIYYYPEERDAARRAGQLAERWYTRLSRTLDHDLSVRPPLVFYASTAHFAQTTVVPGFIGEGIGGVTEHERGRVVMPFAAGLGETDHVLGHELVHVFQRDILRSLNRSMAALPLWYLEGMAEYLSVGGLDPDTAMWLRDAALDDRLPTLDELDEARWFPYRYGQALWAYLADRFGEGIVARSLGSRSRAGAVGRITSAAGVDAETLSADWHKAIRAASDLRAPRLDGAADATTIVAGPRKGGRLNLGPALSPDGSQVVYLSERDEYSVDVYLADARTGDVKRRLVQTAGDAHFDTLQYIGSSGAWDAAGTRFVLAAVRHGEPILSILAVEQGEVLDEISLPGLDEVSSPSWSPDGRQIVFSALKGGFSDLYVVDVETRAVQALTADPFADLQPVWSPDGRTIAFSTDRFSSSLETLTFGAYRLAAFEMASHAITALPALPQAKHIDPQWSPDGRSLFFIADAGGRSNVYRMEPGTGRIFRVTDVSSGVSGITALSPALSIAQDTGRLAFTVYRHGAYELHVRDAAGGTLVPLDPPEQAAPRAAAAGVHSPGLGLADDQTFTVKPYTHGLSLSHVGQPYVSAGGGAFGNFIRAGIQFAFGDMLGEQSLYTSIQAGKSLNDFAVEALYVNRQARWNWAVSAQQLPLFIGAARVSASTASATGEATLTTSRVRYRQIHQQVSGIVMYPFSQSDRVEVSGGLHAIAFNREAITSVSARNTGEVLAETHDTGATYPGVTVLETKAALVHDTALDGPTSPVLGSRYRFELAPTLGTLKLATVTADYRRYWMPTRPFTVAARLSHLGRYGPDHADPRLLPLAYNLRWLVRGFSSRTVSGHLCEDADCAALVYLGATRLFLANAELRFPVIGALRGDASYGPLPIEAFVFSDNAWLPFGLHSAGAGVRLNAAGLVFELAGARRLGGPAPGWAFAVNYRRGF